MNGSNPTRGVEHINAGGKRTRKHHFGLLVLLASQDGLVSNFEIKCFDGCANPHLGLASILAAGNDGLRRHLSLPEPIETNPSLLEGNLQRLPRSLSESVRALENDNVLDDLIGGNRLCCDKSS